MLSETEIVLSQAKPIPALADFLADRKESITKRWIEAVRRNPRLKTATTLDDQSLADHLPKAFDLLTRLLRGESILLEIVETAETHGQHRWQQKYRLVEVGRELSVLCRLILSDGLDRFSDAHGEVADTALREARETILGFFEETSAGSVREYARMQNEQLESLSEQRRLALDSARLGWWHYDLAANKITYDSRFNSIFGVDDTVLSYEGVIGLMHPQDREYVDAAVQSALDPVAPSAYSVEYRVVQPSGEIRWVSARGKASFAGEGSHRRAISFSGTLLDITAEKIARDAMRVGEEKFRSLFESIDEAFAVLEMIWDEAGHPVDYRFIEANPAFAKHTGWESAIGRTAQELIPGLEPHWPETYGKVARTGEPVRFVMEAKGMGRHFDAYAFRIGLPQQHQVALLFRDVTEDQKAERTLREAMAQSEANSRVKDEFLATLSHELRTPLSAILGWTQILRGDPTNSEDVEQGLATIERNARAQTQIIEDLLDMSRIMSGKVRLEVQPLDLAKVVQGAVDTIRPSAETKGIVLQPEIDPHVRFINGDVNRLQQVFWNLLTNAIKFTPRGGSVRVVLERVGTAFQVRVVDSGEGISSDFLPFVFDRFRQQDASTTRRHGGLGLGLAIVRQLVELHGGQVGVESAGPGRGTTFKVDLPPSALVPSTHVVEEPRHASGEAAATYTPIPHFAALAGLKVLIVDDELDARTLIKRLLADQKADVRMAGSAAEALELFQAQKPDLLISDIGMPQEDGYSLIQRIRSLPGEKERATPAIALTAYARTEDRLRAIQSGFQMHVVKPVIAVELLTAAANLATHFR